MRSSGASSRPRQPPPNLERHNANAKGTTDDVTSVIRAGDQAAGVKHICVRLRPASKRGFFACSGAAGHCRHPSTFCSVADLSSAGAPRRMLLPSLRPPYPQRPKVVAGADAIPFRRRCAANIWRQRAGAGLGIPILRERETRRPCNAHSEAGGRRGANAVNLRS